ncbi:Ig-like domain-containing protein [Leucobacter japonicus]|uniref:Ig-like domain-containing protein n=1 Tax=Leucobacter japonicus TaxID=1461259 RepID=UPI0006A7E9CD|nr:tandem-95 repeat protein [Leucobacter japonicus]
MKYVSGVATFALAVSGLAVSAPTAAQAAAPFSATSLYGTQASSNRTIVAIDPATRAVTNSITIPAAAGTTGADAQLNQLGLSVDGNTLMATDVKNIYRYTASNEQVVSTPRPSPALVANTMGGVDPRTGYLFYGGQQSGTPKNFTFVRYNPTTNATLPGVVTVTVPDTPPGGNGDLVFDRLGNMYFVSSGMATGTGANPVAQVYRADVHELDAGSATATAIGGAIPTGSVNSIAFGADGYLYLFGNSRFLKANPITGAIVDNNSISPTALTDLGARATPRTIDLGTDGANPDDPFDISIGGPGIAVGNTGETEADGSGSVGPIIVLPGGTYTIDQKPKPGTTPGNYDTTWKCTDVVSGATVREGTGNSGSFVFPANSPGVTCNFTNVELIPGQAIADESKGNEIGKPVTVPVLGNDTGDVVPGSVTIVSGTDRVKELTVPNEGKWTVDPTTGAITFTPNTGYTGNPSPITYEVTDTNGQKTQANVIVTYAPVAADDQSLNNVQGTTVSQNVLANDQGALSPSGVKIVSGTQRVNELFVDGQGTWTVNATTGAIAFKPLATFSGNPTPITYEVTDADNQTAQAKVTVTYVPGAVDDESANNEQGKPVTVDVLGNDKGALDPTTVKIVDGSTLVTELTVPGEGKWTVDPTTGAITFTPESTFQGSPTPIEYQVNDTAGNPTTGKVTVNFAPLAANDESLNNDQGATVNIPVLDNDLGVLDKTSVKILDGTTPVTELKVTGEGTWTVNTTTGVITFVPEDGFTGNPTPITYRVTDEAGETAQATVKVTYTPGAASDESLKNDQGSTVKVPVLDNDKGALDPTSVKIVSGEEVVTELVVPGQGTWTVDPATGEISFAPEETFSGNPTPITYQVTDTEGQTTTAPVKVTYVPVAANDESLNNGQGATVSVPVLDNDKGALDPTSVKIASGEELVTELVVEGEGTWTVDPETGAISFKPLETFSGNPTPITYQVTDTEGETTEATVTVTYAPAAANDESLNNDQGATVTVPVLGNDRGALNPGSVRIVDGETLKVELVVEGEGTWTVNPANGAISFAPEDGFSGNPTPITYQVADVLGETSQATVKVTYVPEAAADESLNNGQGATVSVPVLDNDKGALDPTSVKIVSGEDLLTELVVPGEGTWTVDPATGAITFAPEDTFSGNPTPITYQVTDTEGETAEATVTVTYVPVAANDESLNNNQGTTVVVPVLDNDKGALDPTSVKIVDGEEFVSELVVEGEGTWTVDPETGAISFKPLETFSGNPTGITYQVSDTEGNTSQADVRVTYVPAAVNDQSLKNAQGSTVTIPVLVNDLGVLGASTVKIVDGELLVDELVVPGEGTWTVNTETGEISFAPEDTFSGNPTPITYQATDENGNPTQATVKVTFVPVAANDESLNNEQGATVLVPVVGNDLGALVASSVQIVDGEEFVTELVVEGEGTWTVDPETGAISFKPLETFSGNPTPITYQVTDTEGETTEATVKVTYVPVAANDESLGNPQGSTVTIPVLGNDKGALDPTSVKIVDGEELVTELVVEGEGTWTVDPVTGTISFAPEDTFSGNPTPITYQVTDTEGNTTEAQVVITFVPAAVNDESLKNAQGSTVTVPVLGNDRGVLVVTSVQIVNGEELVTELVVEGEGTWTVDPETGAITFVPQEGFSGNPTPITYQVTDTNGNATQATVKVTYVPLAANDQSLNNAQGTQVTVPVTGNDLGALDVTTVKLVNGTELVAEIVVKGEGTWTVDPETGAISFAPEKGFSGNPTPVTYQVSDTEGETAQAQVTITYVPVAANDESLNNVSGSTVTVSVTGNDLGAIDPTSVKIVNGEELVTELVVPSEGTWTVNPETGDITFTPEPGFTGNPTPITYQVSDVAGNTTRATVTITYVAPGEPSPPTNPEDPENPADPGTPAGPGDPANPERPADPEDLSRTGGASVISLGIAATLLVLGGLSAVMVGRRRRETRHSA